MSSNKDTMDNFYIDEDITGNNGNKTIIEEYKSDEIFQNELEDELEDINEENMVDESIEQDNNTTNEYIIDNIDTDSDDMIKSIDDNFKNKEISINKFIENNQKNDDS